MRWGIGIIVVALMATTTEAAARETRLHHDVPVLGGKFAQAKAFERLDRLDARPSIEVPGARLVVMKPRRADEAILAWQVTAQDWRVDVDAHTGLVVQKTALRMSERGSGTGIFGDQRVINYSHDAGDDVMIDETRTFDLITLDARNGTDLDRARVVSSPDGKSWDHAAVDAAYHVGATIDFYSDVLGRDGWDKHTHEIVLAVHWGVAFENAEYSFVDDALHFGDGGSHQQPLAAFLDIVAHEYTHAITARTSELDYSGQSGALNEAISDIFGALVEHSVRPDDHDNWLHGEGSLKGVSNIDGADRDFSNPHNGNPSQPAHMDEFVDAGEDDDAGGVHSNSGIINHAAFLMTAGGTNPVSKITVKNPIGWKKLAQLWYKVNTDYLAQSSDFKDAADATLEAARSLKFSDTDVETIRCAWRAVGVLDGDCDQKEYSLSADDDDDVSADDAPAGKKADPSKSEGEAALAPAASCSAAPAQRPSGDVALIFALLVIGSRAARGSANTSSARGARRR